MKIAFHDRQTIYCFMQYCFLSQPLYTKEVRASRGICYLTRWTDCATLSMARRGSIRRLAHTASHFHNVGMHIGREQSRPYACYIDFSEHITYRLQEHQHGKDSRRNERRRG